MKSADLFHDLINGNFVISKFDPVNSNLVVVLPVVINISHAIARMTVHTQILGGATERWVHRAYGSQIDESSLNAVHLERLTNSGFTPVFIEFCIRFKMYGALGFRAAYRRIRTAP